MNNAEVVRDLTTGIEISPPQLHKLTFVFDGPSIPPGSPYRTEFDLELSRFGLRELGVQFGVKLAGLEGLEAYASFRMVFKIPENSPHVGHEENVFRALAARVGPMAMFPFIREALATAAIKAHVLGVLLPIMNVGGLYDPEQIKLPPPVDQTKLGSGEGE
jgi:hypothetical protein